MGVVAREYGPFELHNRGLARLGDVLVYDIHYMGDRPHPALIILAQAVGDAVRLLLR